MKCKFCNTEMDYLEQERNTYSCPNCSAEATVFENLSEPMWLNPTEPVTCSECKHCRPYYYNTQINDWLFICVKAKKQPAIIGDSMTIYFTSNHVCQTNN